MHLGAWVRISTRHPRGVIHTRDLQSRHRHLGSYFQNNTRHPRDVNHTRLPNSKTLGGSAVAIAPDTRRMRSTLKIKQPSQKKAAPDARGLRLTIEKNN